MKFDSNKFKKNISFFIIGGAIVVLLLLISILAGSSSRRLEEEELEANKDVNISSLVINEVMSSNKGTIADEKGKLYDYVEIYNGHDYNINLKNYGLSDAPTVKWVFPDVTIKAKSYLVVFLSGTKEDGLHANFKLSSSGEEQLGLFKPNGKVIDAIDTVSLEKDTVMARGDEGKWVIQLKPTPGFANTTEGHTAFLKSLMSEEDKKVVINEVLPNNKGNFMSSLGEFSGYIEVKNNSDETVNLENYGLSNSEDANFKWQFPSLKLASGEVVVVFTSNKNIKVDELHASFKLNNENGYAILSDNSGKIVDKVKYEGLGNGYAYIREGDKFLESNIISPGFDNTNDGVEKFQDKYLKNHDGLIINEVMNNNYEYLAQNSGKYYDWIELYNNSDKEINLKDYFLTTNTDTIDMYNLPDVKLGKNEYYVLMASGNEKLSNNSYKHTNFNISETQGLYLVQKKKVVDSLFVANVPQGYSMGRGKNSGVYYFNKPTPKAANGSGNQTISYVPVSSVKTGIYNKVENLKVELTGNDPIYYTTDGSEPTTSSKRYSSPLTITKTTVLRVMSKEDGKMMSKVNTYSYIVNENHNIPVISLAISPSNLKALHSHAWTEGYEKLVYVNFMELDNTGFEIPAGLKLFGGSTRGHAKKSYELKFQKQYGAGSLKYQVFPDKDYSTFSSVVLRTGSQDEMGTASKKTMLRDLVSTSLLDKYTSVDVQAYRPVAMYLNGSYWGLYFIREKIDETLVGNHYNVAADKTNTDVLRIDSQLKSGSRTKYSKLVSFLTNNSMSNSANYAKVKEMIDIENICDFWIAESWTTNNDIVNVRYFSNDEVDNGKWKFVFYDIDFGWYNVDRDYFKFATSASGMTSAGYSTFILRNLMKSKEFQQTFVERLSYNLKNTWDSDTVLKKIDSVIEEITEDEFKRNFERWNFSYSSWKTNVEFIKNYAKKRNGYMIKQAKSFFGLSSTEVEKYFGGVK